MKLDGWRAYGAAFLAGAAAALAMPPWYWLPFAVIGLAVYVWLWQSAISPRSALLRGWAWGLGHFAVGSYWIVEAFFVPPADYKLLGPPIVFGLAAVLGFFPGMAAGATRWAALRWPFLADRYRSLVLLAIAWTVAEWLRGHVFTGYPWNPLAHVWAFASPLLQGAALFGVYGLGTFTFLILVAPLARWRGAAAAMFVVVLAGVAGLMTMEPAPDKDGPWVRIVQPNIAQGEKWRRDLRMVHFAKLVDMSRRAGFERLKLVVWPETAAPFVIEPDSAGLPIMARAAPEGGYLLTGAARANQRIDDGVWNSLLAVDQKGAVVAHYDKVHLVPLGEYIPFHKQLAPVSGMIGRGSFEVGESFLTLSLPGVPAFSPIICYEVIFPAAVTGPSGDSGKRPQWLLNVTNDAWFGVSSGPYQHLTSARLRTIEEGLPMIRAANTGISAVIDAYGNVLASLDMQREGIIDHVLPAARAATPYARWGDATLLAVLAGLGFVIVWLPRKRGRGGG